MPRVSSPRQAGPWSEKCLYCLYRTNTRTRERPVGMGWGEVSDKQHTHTVRKKTPLHPLCLSINCLVWEV